MLYILTLLALIFVEESRFVVPYNYIMLFLFTGSMAFMLAGITAWLTPLSVLLAIGVLGLVLLSLFIVFLFFKDEDDLWPGLLISMVLCSIL